MHFNLEEALFFVDIILKKLNIDVKQAARMMENEQRELVENLVERTIAIEGMMKSEEINNYGRAISYIVYLCRMHKR